MRSGQEAGGQGAWPNEGEGSRSAARKFNRDQQSFVRSDKVAKKAEDARKAIEGAEAKELEKAEAEGRRHSKGEDPEVRR